MRLPCAWKPRRAKKAPKAVLLSVLSLCSVFLVRRRKLFRFRRRRAVGALHLELLPLLLRDEDLAGLGAFKLPHNAAPDQNAADDVDELLPAAIDVVMETGQASVSMLQRRLKLGYSRAARIIDQIEERGIIGPFEGSKPRQILISREEWQEMKLRRNMPLE